MADNNRNEDRTSGRSEKENRNINENKKTQNVSNQKEQERNPQKGSKWSNYQTRELSNEDYSDENIAGGQSA